MEELRNLAIDGLIADFVENPPYFLTTEHVSGVSLRIDAFWLRWERAVRWPGAMAVSPLRWGGIFVKRFSALSWIAP
jgi:hypothetical protein